MEYSIFLLILMSKPKISPLSKVSQTKTNIFRINESHSERRGGEKYYSERAGTVERVH